MRAPARRGGAGFFLALGLLLAADAWYDTHVLGLERVSLTTSRLPAGERWRILQLSDLHGQLVGGIERMLELAREARPDLLALTGDLLDRDTRDLEPVLALVAQLRQLQGAVYFVRGNHEHWNPMGERFVAELSRRGVTVLDNSHAQLRQGSRSLQVAGVDDAYSGRDDVGRAIAGLDPGRFTLMLSHAPGAADRIAGLPVDLMLSGHTHGGQVRVPVLGGLYAPGGGFFPRYDKGRYELAPAQWLYVDSGVGTSLVPLRLLNPAQLTLLEISGLQK